MKTNIKLAIRITVMIRILLLLCVIPAASLFAQQEKPVIDPVYKPERPKTDEQMAQKVYGMMPKFDDTQRPIIALRTNLLYAIGAMTPNLGVELGVSPRSTLLLTGSYNPWNADGSADDNKKLNHWLTTLEYRLWTCERFNGHFFGVHGMFGNYNIAGYDLPSIYKKRGAKDYPYTDFRYKGYAYGGGVSYGYQLMFAKHFGVELNLGVGVIMTNFDRYERPNCGHCRAKNQQRTFITPTKAAVSLIYIIK